ncbi:MAG: hypothetical protein MJE68_09910, partial [Proteobacteria bacterium]|nr:hypothetical protein [Pseudomonadota bacterium]
MDDPFLNCPLLLSLFVSSSSHLTSPPSHVYLLNSPPPPSPPPPPPKEKKEEEEEEGTVFIFATVFLSLFEQKIHGDVEDLEDL